MSTGNVELIHVRLKGELDRLGLKPAAAAKQAGEPDSQGLRDVLGGRKRLSADLLAGLALAGVDAAYVVTGVRGASAINDVAIHQAVLDAIELLSLEGKIDAQQLAKAVVKLCRRSTQSADAGGMIQSNVIKGGRVEMNVGINHGQVAEGNITNSGTVTIGQGKGRDTKT